MTTLEWGSKWGARIRAVVVTASLALGSLVSVACGSSDENAEAPSTGDDHVRVGWAASAETTEKLAVDEWFLEGTARHSEIMGLHRGPEPDSYRIFAHATIETSEDSLRVEVDLPEHWVFDGGPTGMPDISGPVTPAVAYTLASAILDAPQGTFDGPAQLRAKSVVSGSIAPRDGLTNPGGTPLIEGCVELLPSMEDGDRFKNALRRHGRTIALVLEYDAQIRDLHPYCNISAQTYNKALCESVLPHVPGKGYQWYCDPLFRESLDLADYFKKQREEQARSKGTIFAYGSCGNQNCVKRMHCSFGFVEYAIGDTMLANCGEHFTK